MILEILRDSFEYTFNDTSILKLGILSLLSFLIIPIFILYGYSYRTTLIGINSMLNKRDKKPTFDKFGEMLIQGVKLAILSLIYSLPGIIATYLLTVEGFIFRLIRIDGISRIDFSLEFVVLLSLIWFICFIFVSVAIPNMINNNGSLKAGFKIKEILSIIKNIGILNYIKFALTWLIIFIGILIIIFLVVQLLISFMGGSGLITGLVTIATYTVISLFFIVPIFLLSISRAIALIYNMGE